MAPSTSFVTIQSGKKLHVLLLIIRHWKGVCLGCLSAIRWRESECRRLHRLHHKRMERTANFKSRSSHKLETANDRGWKGSICVHCLTRMCRIPSQQCSNSSLLPRLNQNAHLIMWRWEPHPRRLSSPHRRSRCRRHGRCQRFQKDCTADAAVSNNNVTPPRLISLWLQSSLRLRQAFPYTQ